MFPPRAPFFLRTWGTSRFPHPSPLVEGSPVSDIDNDLARRNSASWALFGLFWLLFLGTAIVAVLYLQLD